MDWIAGGLAFAALIAFFVRELCVKKTPPEILALQVLVVGGSTTVWGFAMMLMADKLWPYYRDWKQLEVSVDDLPFVGSGFFWGLFQGAVLGIWGARKINNEPLNQERPRP